MKTSGGDPKLEAADLARCIIQDAREVGSLIKLTHLSKATVLSRAPDVSVHILCDKLVEVSPR